MGRNTSITQVVKIRQVYSRHGKVYCAVSLPFAIMQALAWEPGGYLMAYPTKDGGMKLTPSTKGVGDDFAEDLVPGADSIRPPKPGSIHEREVEVEMELEDLIDRMRAPKMSRLRRRVDRPEPHPPVSVSEVELEPKPRSSSRRQTKPQPRRRR